MSLKLPHSIDAEQALLGAILLYPQSFQTVVETGLAVNDFFLEAHKKIFLAAKELDDQGKNIDATILINRLVEKKHIAQIGGSEYIMELIGTATTSSNVKHYVEIIKNKAQLRQLIEVAHTILESSSDDSQELNEVFDQAEKLILDVTHNRLTGDFRDSDEVTESVMELVKRMSQNKSGITGMKTGYTDLDSTTNGFQKGDLIILAARPSMGKTAFALNLAMKIAHLNKLPVAIFSLEMPAEQLISRMLSARAQINGSQIRTGYLAQQEWNRLNEAALFMKNLPIYIDDSPVVKASEMMAKCRKLKKDHGLGAVVIDYIQLIAGGGKSDSRQQEVSEISRSLKALARELEVPVIALSQLSRSVEQRVDKRPMLSDLRESGAIEQDADIVMFLYRDNYYNDPNKDLPEAEQPVKKDGVVDMEVIIAKHRNGPTNKVILSFASNINSFFNTEGQGKYES